MLTGRAPARTFGLAFAIWFGLAASWALSSPLFGVPDEAEHIKRVAQLSEGVLVGERTVIETPPPDASIATRFVGEVPQPFQVIGPYHVCYALAAGTPDCMAPLEPAEGTAVGDTSAGAYQPTFYAPLVLPIEVLTPAEAVYGMRLMSAGLAALLLAGATTSLLVAFGWRGLVGLLLAVTPMVVFLGGSANPNGTEIAAAVAVWAAALALVRDPRTGDAVLLGAAGSYLAAVRPLSPAFLLIILAVVALAAPWDRVRTALVHRPTRRALAVVAVVLCLSAAWVVRFDSLGSLLGFPQPELTGMAALEASLDLTVWRLEQMVGLLGYVDVVLPDPVWRTWLLAVAALALAALWQAGWRVRLVLPALVLGVLAMPVVSDVMTAAELGLAWQGRYTLPLAVGIPLLAATSLRDGPRRVHAGAAAVVAVGAAGVHILAHLHSMARSSLGLGPGFELATHPWTYLAEPGWTTPVGDVPVLVLVLVATGGIAAVGVWSGVTAVRGGRPASDPGPGADSLERPPSPPEADTPSR